MSELILDETTIISNYLNKEVENLSKNAYEFVMADKKVRIINSDKLFCKALADKLAENRPFGVAWWFNGLAKRFEFSLASKENGMDVSLIANNFGGSGDKNSAYFELGFEEMERLFDITGTGN